MMISMKINSIASITCSYMVLFIIKFACTTEVIEIPDDFLIGAGISAFQFEGAWNISDKGESNLDVIFGKRTINGITSDFYHKYKEDIEIAKKIGFNHFRFSLSWARIMPDGSNNNISQDGLQFYHNVIDEIRKNGMEPFVTIYHWDHPKIFSNFNDWLDERMINYFVNYSRVVFENFGSKVKFWSTMNEPDFFCSTDFFGKHSSNKYSCLYKMLKAHAEVYHLYDDEFRAKQGGKIGVVGACEGFLPENSESHECPSILYETLCGWIFNPIFSKDGGWSDVIKNDINHKSNSAPPPPSFTPEEINYIKGTADYVGFTYYTAYICKLKSGYDPSKKSSYEIEKYENVSIPTEPNANFPIRTVPQAFRLLLNTIKDKYNNPPMYILENGCSSYQGLNDTARLKYLKSHLKEAILARTEDGCNIQKYTVWSFLDGFEWSGYKSMGLVEVDFNSTNLTRKPRLSAEWFQEILSNRSFT